MENQVNQPVLQNTKKGGLGTKGIIILVSSIVAALLIIVVVIMLLFPSPKSVANKYLSGYKSMNANKLLSTMHPKVKNEFKDEVKDEFQEMKEEKVKIKSIKLDSDYEEVDDDELELYAKYLEEEYNISESSIKEMRRYDVELEYSYDGETDEEDMYVFLAKIGMKWYVLG